MYKTNLTVLTQISQLIDKNIVNKVIREHNANKHSKGFPLWNQLLCMLFSQLAYAQSLRDITYGMSSTAGNLHHLGIRRLPKRSTLSYSNKHRSWEVFRDIYEGLFHRLQHALPGGNIKFRIKSKIYLLDSTVISVSLKVFDWAKFRVRKGALKLHTLLDYQGAMPEYMYLTEGKKSDVALARSLVLPSDSVVVADRGYYDFNLLYQWHKQGVRFVVRIRNNMLYDVVKNRSISHENIVQDQIVIPTGPSGKHYQGKLRRIEVWDEKKKHSIILLTNELRNWTAETISHLYKARWEIELFFKDVKQHLKIKSFVGTSVNAVLTQIWRAMIALLLLKYLKAKAKFGWNLSNLVSFIRFTLFANVNLFEWINKPIFTEIRSGPPANQLTLF